MKLVVVTGVGTGIGKTHLAAALTLAWGRSRPVLAYKPVESGVAGEVGEDEAALSGVSTFHVKPPALQLRFKAPVSPHLAARLEGAVLPVDEVVREVARLRAMTRLVVELPGGLFSPLSTSVLNVDLVARLAPDVTLLVAPDRLGVLHDVLAVVDACRLRRLALTGVVLMSPASPDASTGTNADELRLLCPVPVLASLPRASVSALAASDLLPAVVFDEPTPT